MSRPVQETLSEALVRPAEPRVFAHTGCGGWVLFRLVGGFCLSCEAGPLKPGEYAKPGTVPVAGVNTSTSREAAA